MQTSCTPSPLGIKRTGSLWQVLCTCRGVPSYRREKKKNFHSKYSTESLSDTSTHKVRYYLMGLQIMGACLALSFVSRWEIIRKALFWIIMQRVVVIPYRRFRITYLVPCYILLTVHLVMIPGKWPNRRTVLPYVFISVLYMFRVTLCSSSGGSIVSIHLVYVTLCRWPFRVWVGKELI